MVEHWVTGGLLAIMVLVLTLPFFSGRVEKQLELFLFLTGILSVTIAGQWSWHLVHAALVDPIKITLAVLIAGLLFRLIRPKIGGWTSYLAKRVGFAPLFFVLVVGLGLLSWINIVSAVLDNATVTAAEITPRMSEQTLRTVLLGLLIVGGMLIPGNIPNIICANKLSIKSSEWARGGGPLGLVLMIGVFAILLVAG